MFFRILFCFTICIFVSTIEGYASLTAVSYSLHARLLYQKLRKEGKCEFHVSIRYFYLGSVLIKVYSSQDPVILEASNQESICEDIAGSGFFHWWRLIPVDKEEIHRNRYHPKYSEVFYQIYTPGSSPDSYEYNNSLRPYEFLLMGSLHYMTEHVFLCPLKSLLNKDIMLFFVSKEYDVSPFDGYVMPGRFVFADFTPGHPSIHNYIILAEEPARAYVEPNFNVEIHYLRMRKHVQPGKVYRST